MQAEVDSLHMEVKRKDSSLDIVNTEKERALRKIKNEEGRTKAMSPSRLQNLVHNT